jgi:DNA-binding HxlR family transcriptional regulator
MLKHTRCGAKGENCPIYGIKCGSEIEICPIYRTFRIIGKKWALQILQEFFVNKGKRRFNQIQKSLYWITPKVLSKRLREMEAEGLIRRKIFLDKIPVRVEYKLTKKGEGLDEVIKEAKKWGMKWEVVE